MVTEKTSKNIKKFYCDLCDFECCKKGDYTRHLSTRKHKMVINGNNMVIENAQNTSNDFKCICGKSYKHNSGYSRHKKTCTFINEEKETNNVVTPEMFMELMKVVVKQGENQSNIQQQQTEIMKEIIPKIGNTTNNTNCHNTTNKFNMNIFLNETCKDAIPLVEFINNIQLQLNDLTLTGEKGLVEGVSQIFIKGLNELELTKRPIHCSDPKREIMYIKDVNEWKKDDKNNSMVKDAIEKVKDDNFRQLERWQNEHPHHQDRDHPDNKIFLDLVQNCLDGTDEDKKKNNMKKIIKNIANEVVVKKEINN